MASWFSKRASSWAATKTHRAGLVKRSNMRTPQSQIGPRPTRPPCEKLGGAGQAHQITLPTRRTARRGGSLPTRWVTAPADDEIRKKRCNGDNPCGDYCCIEVTESISRDEDTPETTTGTILVLGPDDAPVSCTTRLSICTRRRLDDLIRLATHISGSRTVGWPTQASGCSAALGTPPRLETATAADRY